MKAGTRFGIVATLLATWVVVAGCPSEEGIEKGWFDRKDKAQQVQAKYPYMKALMQQGIDEATKLYDEAKAKPEGERKDGLRAAIKRLSTLMAPFEAYDEKHKEIAKLKADPELKKLQATEKTLLNVIVKAADDRIKEAETLLQKAKASNPGERTELLKQATAILDKGAAGLRELKAKSVAAATSGAAAVTTGAAAVVSGANTCPTCGKQLKSAQGLADHTKAAHPVATNA
ncbi:MAG: hypothetical protein ACYTFT_08195, partial [Planctomycetota bacterium]